jgi:hypothetical protein
MLRGLGWSPRRTLAAGVAETYDWLLEHQKEAGLADTNLRS